VLFVVAIEDGDLEALSRRVAEERGRERAWWREERERALTGAQTLGERAAALAGVRAERARLRASGRLLGSRDALLAHAVRRVLDARGWACDWPEVPEGAASTPGRRWGVTPRDGRGGGARLAVRLPDALGEQVRRVAYWTSAGAVEALIAWQDRYGPGAGAALGEAAAGRAGAGVLLLSAALRRPSAEAMAARREARRKIVTVGDILRAAAACAAAGGAHAGGTRRTGPSGCASRQARESRTR
jgi:hypothetical protein